MKIITFWIVILVIDCFGFNSSEFFPIDSGNQWKYYYSKSTGCSYYVDSYTNFDSLIKTVSIKNVWYASDTTKFTVTIRDSGIAKHGSKGTIQSTEKIDKTSEFEFMKINDSIYWIKGNGSFIPFFDNYVQDDNLCQKVLFNNDSLIVISSTRSFRSYTFLQNYGLLQYRTVDQLGACGASSEGVQIISFTKGSVTYTYDNFENVKINKRKTINRVTSKPVNSGIYDLCGKRIVQLTSSLSNRVYIKNKKKVISLP